MNRKRKICVSLGEETQEKMIEASRFVQKHADVIELRIDYLQQPDINELVSQVNTPVLCTARAQWEEGRFIGDEKSRLELLCSCVDAGTSYIDIELNSPKSSIEILRRKIDKSSIQLIISQHDFQKTPSIDELIEKVERMREAGADIGKLITTAHTSNDVMTMLSVLQFANTKNFPIIGFCMGDAGGVSRVITCEFGGYMTYCCKDTLTATAPGQIDAKTMVEIYSRF